MSNWNDCLWTEEVAWDITYNPPTMLYWVLSPDSLTTIHTWAHLALSGGLVDPSLSSYTCWPVAIDDIRHVKPSPSFPVNATLADVVHNFYVTA